MADQFTTVRIRESHFGILSPEEIRKQAVTLVDRPISRKDEPNRTLMDPQMGVSASGISQINLTNHLTQRHDPGCYGYLELPSPVIHPGFYDFIRKILNAVCPVCSSVRVKKTLSEITKLKRKKNNATRFLYISEQGRKINKCPSCDSALPSVKSEKEMRVLGLVFEYTDKSVGGKPQSRNKHYLAPEEIYAILRKIPDDDCWLLGFDPKNSHPAWMMWTVVPISPPTVRPSVQADNGKISEDDLTFKYNELIKSVNALRHEMALIADSNVVNDQTDGNNLLKLQNAVQWDVATLINNESNNYPRATNRAQRELKTLRQRLKGKPGRIRGNLMGKRVDASARTVITADPNISIDQVGVPIQIAQELTYPEKVNHLNISRLTTLVRRGNNYPGARRIKRKNERYPRDLQIIDHADLTLDYGDVVYRHLLDGDVVLMNRQPSLHRMSMMAHRVKVMSLGQSFRLNVNVTSPYNADFDGDEMNMHVPQSLQAVYELLHLAMVSTQIVSPQSSIPVIGLVQDSLLGIYRMTSEHIRGYDSTKGEIDYLNWSHFMKLTGWLNNYQGQLPSPLATRDFYGWTARQLITMILPNINVNKGGLKIIDGHYPEPEYGQEAIALNKRQIGPSASNGIVHITWNDYGSGITRKMMDDFSRITSQWLLIKGFSMGVRDIEVDRKVVQGSVEAIKQSYMRDAQQLIDGLHLNNYEEVRNRIIGQPRGLARTEFEQFESDMIYLLAQLDDKVKTETSNNLDNFRNYKGERRDNCLSSMVNAGSKGSKANMVSIIASLGQQVIDGGRVVDNYYRRPNPYAPKDDLTPETRGFVANSYAQGLTPIEFLAHASAGRIGVVSTSIKTADTGYVQRKLVKSCEDVVARYDRTCRNANDRIIQFSYGGDGCDGSHLEKINIPWLGYRPSRFAFTYRHQADNDGLNDMLDDETWSRFTANMEAENRAMADEFNELKEYRQELTYYFKYKVVDSLPCPFNIQRIISNVQHRLKVAQSIRCDLTPREIIEKVNQLSAKLVINGDDVHVNNGASYNMNLLLKSYLNSKKLIYTDLINSYSLEMIISDIQKQFENSIVNPGEAVGIIASQSIGEPSTQLTLDTFHHTGSGEQKANVSLGIPRLKEIISVSKNTKTPSVTFYLADEAFWNLSIAEPVAVAGAGADPSDSTVARKTIEAEKILADMNAGGEFDREQIRSKRKQYQELVTGQIKKLKSDFDFTVFGDLVAWTEIIYDPHDNVREEDRDFLQLYKQFSNSTCENGIPWVIRFILDAEKMEEHNIDPMLLNLILSEKTEVDCILSHVKSSQDNRPILICRARPVLYQNQSQSEDASEQPYDPIQILENTEKLLNETTIKGIHGITKTSLRRIDSDIIEPDHTIIKSYSDGYEEAKEGTLRGDRYIIDTVGDNFIQVMNLPYVDTERTITNDIRAVYDYLGIEAAREAIIEGILEVMDNSDASIGRRHIELLADIMTYRGILLSVDRHGSKKGDSGPWARASFEETTSELFKASAFSEEDNMKGVSANVMAGQCPPIGTNCFDMGFDEQMLLNGFTAETEEMYKNMDNNQADLDVQKENFRVCNQLDTSFDFAI